jgi:hypothetical protein
MTMKIEIAKQWVEALTSGTYQQGQGKLHSTDRNGECMYCCLGVLCDLYRQQNPDEVDVKVVTRKDQAEPQHYQMMSQFDDSITVYDNDSVVLPLRVREWAGMSDPLGRFIDSESHGQDSLAELNDHGMSFAKLADVITAHVAEL